ncbi:hypothetical protein GCQ56_16430 [Marinifilum sp. N1E240]|uniref:hypothetical protein n=1 Tax=Marinifilum sp. N1E240 TaxID=2608082 RepID=UPI00128DB9AF|nr:hypothetical protein [Marinifilum sp. N1E240]MPQ48593.1 hypothetical protein [Marinifilum sp. N1E240]
MNRIYWITILLITQCYSCLGQTLIKESDFSNDEKKYLHQLAEKISENDQKYRNYLSNKTMDDDVIAKIDSVFDNYGIQQGWTYRSSLKLSLDKHISDSLWQLQHRLDFENHLLLRGMLNTYGYLPKSILKEKHYLQVLLLLHPPKDWDVKLYQESYTQLFLHEIKAGRMPAKDFANFYDNMQAKILREPQLYGTNKQYDNESKSILPPIIRDLQETNKARVEIGLPLLKDGEYRIIK